MPIHLSRRRLLKTAAAGSLALGLGLRARGAEEKPKTILLKSGWQTENIGDIAHSPGVLTLLEQHLPEVEVIYWPNSFDRGVEPMLRRRFPKLRVVQGNCDAEGRPQTEELAAAFQEADLLMHGSGPSVVGRRFLSAWRKGTGKPYGIYGVTIQEIDAELRALLAGAAFVFTRETHSLKNLEKAGITEPATGFAPDGTFALDLRDDERAEAFLREHGLEERKFLCVVPRLRYTPYHKIRRVSWSAEEIARREAVNEKHAEADHAKLREAIIRWVRETGNKVLACPEMTYQLEIIGPLVVEPLPDDVKPHVVARKTYWLPDEAGSVYRRAHTVVSMECHSPIIAAAHGTPAFYLRQPEDTIKGQMWYDLGFTDWVFEIEETSGKQVADRLMEVAGDYPAAQRYLAAAMERCGERHRTTLAEVRKGLGLAERSDR